MVTFPLMQLAPSLTQDGTLATHSAIFSSSHGTLQTFRQSRRLAANEQVGGVMLSLHAAYSSLTLMAARLPGDVRKFLTVDRKQYLAADNLVLNITDAITALKHGKQNSYVD